MTPMPPMPAVPKQEKSRDDTRSTRPCPNAPMVTGETDHHPTHAGTGTGSCGTGRVHVIQPENWLKSWRWCLWLVSQAFSENSAPAHPQADIWLLVTRRLGS